LIVVLVASVAGTVSAHRIYVDVTSQDVEIEAYYGDGTPVRNGDVTVYLPNGDVYLTNKTDDDGRFSFEVKNVDAEYLVIEVEQTGHKAEVTLGTAAVSSGEEVPPYQAAIAGLGYLLGLAGIATLYATWRLKKREGEDEA
jgi:nickel transport protein